MELNTIERKIRNFEKNFGFQNEIKWRLTLFLTFLHCFGLYWSCLHALPCKWQTFLFGYCTGFCNALGITAGVHRLWTHKCYKAALPVRIFLMLSFSSAGQNSIYDWVRDHRVHHKFSDTDADPHNINRGFFFSHIGWLMTKKNANVIEKGRQIDMSDIMEDPVCVFNKKYQYLLSILSCYILPTLFGIFVIGERWQCAVAWHIFIRILFILHIESSVNSFAHMFGNKPYNRMIEPSENPYVSFMTVGEGWHNYHHTFPTDWKASEHIHIIDGATIFIKLCSKLGLTWDLKEPSPELLRKVVNEGTKEKKLKAA